MHGRFAARTLYVGLALTALVAAAAAQPTAPGTDLVHMSRSLEDVAAAVRPAVVQVFVSGYAGRGGVVEATGELLSRQRGMGSGVILDRGGYIVTNAHVVAGARRVQVRLPGAGDAAGAQRSILTAPGELLGAQIVGVDPETDLAVLKVPRGDLPVLQLADSDSVRTGQLVIAFGSPLGLESTVTMGVVSSVARQLRDDDPMIYIQTDAPINPGSSGGALVDARGRVVGINTLILSHSGGSEGIGFAAPSNIVRNVFEQLRSTGTVRRGAIGVQAQTITPTLAAALGLRRDRGVILGDVQPGSPAAAAGLRIGDVILTLDGKAMENGRQFDVNLYRRRAGQEAAIEFLRGDAQRTVSVRVVERPDVTRELMPLVDPQTNVVVGLGILALDVTPDVAAQLPSLRLSHGVVVVGRAADAPYVDRGILPGDVIHQVNGHDVRTLAELRQALQTLPPTGAVALQVERHGQMQFIAFEMEPDSR